MKARNCLLIAGLSLFLTIPCWAEVPIVDRACIPNLVVEHVLSDVPNNMPVVIDVVASDFTIPIESRLKEALISQKLELFEELDKDHHLVSISLYDHHEFFTRKSGLFPKKKRYVAYNFAYQVTEMPNQRIVIHKNFKVSTQLEEVNISGSKWYDTLLISLIVGGLAYLFYFGAN